MLRVDHLAFLHRHPRHLLRRRSGLIDSPGISDIPDAISAVSGGILAKTARTMPPPPTMNFQSDRLLRVLLGALSLSILIKARRAKRMLQQAPSNQIQLLIIRLLRARRTVSPLHRQLLHLLPKTLSGLLTLGPPNT